MAVAGPSLQEHVAASTKIGAYTRNARWPSVPVGFNCKRFERQMGGGGGFG